MYKLKTLFIDFDSYFYYLYNFAFATKDVNRYDDN